MACRRLPPSAASITALLALSLWLAGPSARAAERAIDKAVLVDASIDAVWTAWLAQLKKLHAEADAKAKAAKPD